jgi:tRNA threonylcarbamoyl adenosine modification protein YjeE
VLPGAISVHDLPDDEATRRAGRLLASILAEGDVVALLGDLGAGKTCLSKAAISTLCGVDEDEVTSPTFVLVREYEGRAPDGPAALHMDAYRLNGPFDLENLDLQLGTGPVAFVEWAEKVAGALPAARLTLELEHHEGGRRLQVSGLGERGLALATAFEERLRSPDL